MFNNMNGNSELEKISVGIPQDALLGSPRPGTYQCPTRYEVFRKRDLLWYWVLRSATHEAVAKSAQGYKNKEDCLDSIALVKSTANGPIWDLNRQEGRLIN